MKFNHLTTELTPHSEQQAAKRSYVGVYYGAAATAPPPAPPPLFQSSFDRKTGWIFEEGERALHASEM